MKTNINIFLLLLNILIQFILNDQPCDSVASLPSDLKTLIPDYEEQFKIHIFNNYFLEQGERTEFKIIFPRNSVFKMSLTPKYLDVNLLLTSNKNGGDMENKQFSLSRNLPFDFTTLKASAGEEVTVIFEISNENSVENQVLLKRNYFCNSPYMEFELYIEATELFNTSVEDINKITKKFPKLNLNLNDLFGKVYEKNSVKSDMSKYKLATKSLNYYSRWNISVIEDFEFEIKTDEYVIRDDNKPSSSFNHKMKYMFKLTMHSDFFIGGHYHFVLFKSSSLDSGALNGLGCVHDGQCIISERLRKNSADLQTILTPGNYKIILVNLQNKKTNKELRALIPFVPISVVVDIERYEFDIDDNLFDCIRSVAPYNS